ncbi:hemerythrin [Cupriavidus sp. UYMU48A]|nr:hemerythrin [Cupriavidus sp. UYMU48A]
MDTLQWDDELLIGHPAIDHEHQEFLALVRTLRDVPVASISNVLDALHKLAQSHFGHEDRLMEETDFPPRKCHIGEHAAVLASMAGVRNRLGRGDVVTVRRLAHELDRWFPAHVQHLDSALAHWICKQTAGAKPVVFRRWVTPGLQPD